MTIICITGKAGAGKDTLGEYIRDYIAFSGKKAVICHNADLLKEILKNYFGWDGRKDAEGRAMLQNIGTEVMRAKDPDIHVKFIDFILNTFEGYWDYVIIPDCRFPNEVDYWREKGYYAPLIRVTRPDNRNLNRLKGALAEHSSEKSMDNYDADMTIANDNSKLKLRLEAEKICNRLFASGLIA